MADASAKPTRRGPESVDVQEIRRTRSFEGVVGQLRDVILDGTHVPGDRFAAERDLAAQFGVSRTTVREAIRALESEGLVEVRLGSGGGIFISRPSGDRVGTALDSMMNLRQTSQWEIQEYRRDFEPENAALAARRATHEDVERLQAAVDRYRRAIHNGAALAGLDRLSADVHEAIASATHNEVRLSIMMALASAATRALEQRPNPLALRVHLGALSDYDAIVVAIDDNDPVTAANLMAEHLNRIP
jgi:GntR family transcriptional regulator, transcriptional repressor for pyruvate dehydrogenase complex